MRRFDTVFRNIRSFEVAVDFPNVNSNQTISNDVVTTESFPLGTHILSWGFGSDATDIDDMILQFYFVDTDTLRYTLQNPTGGAIDPGSIDVQFVTGEFNPDLVEPI